MEQECELLERCGLFKKYQPTDDLACEWFIDKYCSGLGISRCRRKRFYAKYGIVPPDDMLPTGTMIVREIEERQLLLRS